MFKFFSSLKSKFQFILRGRKFQLRDAVIYQGNQYVIDGLFRLAVEESKKDVPLNYVDNVISFISEVNLNPVNKVKVDFATIFPPNYKKDSEIISVPLSHLKFVCGVKQDKNQCKDMICSVLRDVPVSKEIRQKNFMVEYAQLCRDSGLQIKVVATDTMPVGELGLSGSKEVITDKIILDPLKNAVKFTQSEEKFILPFMVVYSKICNRYELNIRTITPLVVEEFQQSIADWKVDYEKSSRGDYPDNIQTSDEWDAACVSFMLNPHERYEKLYSISSSVLAAASSASSKI